MTEQLNCTVLKNWKKKKERKKIFIGCMIRMYNQQNVSIVFPFLVEYASQLAQW